MPFYEVIQKKKLLSMSVAWDEHVIIQGSNPKLYQYLDLKIA